jgi:gliding motility associated protien GldN
MKKQLSRFFLVVICLVAFTHIADAQKRKATKRGKSSTKTVKGRTNARVSKNGQVDTIAAPPVVVVPPPPPPPDTLPIPKVRKSLRRDEAVVTDAIRDRTPLTYTYIRADDAVYRHRIWREIDAREKMNLPFRYAADENNGNQRFVSILLKAIADSAVTCFNSIDDRFTTPMTIAEVTNIFAGPIVQVPVIDSLGNQTGTVPKRLEVSIDSFYKFEIKEEVIFDKQTSRLYWRILGIAPIKQLYTTSGVFIGDIPMFWVYYPDMRPILAKYEIYNGKNWGARMSWEELFESRMFTGRIIKTTIDNPYDQFIREMPELKDSPLFQLYEGEKLKDQIFNYEQDLWSY